MVYADQTCYRCVHHIHEAVTHNKMKKEKYLNENIFIGLKNLNDGFDAKTIYYFSETDFEIVLNRIDQLGLGIWGIEPWIS